jgi:glyoxylase-like metal-dependent hydrolase (beta-lactamase superfamily II)
MQIAENIFYAKTSCCTYLIREGNLGTVIDPGIRPGRVESLIHEAGLTGLRQILITHFHLDHCLAAPTLQRRYHVPICGNPADGSLVDQRLDPGDVLDVSSGLHIVASPGHTPTHISFHLPIEYALFSGDALQNKGGRLTKASAFFNNDPLQAEESYQALLKLQFTLLCPGHREPILRRNAQTPGDNEGPGDPLVLPF